MTAPGVAFTLADRSDPDDPREILRLDAEAGDLFDALAPRLRVLLGADFVANALPIDAGRDGLHLGGFAALPTFSRGAAVAQHLFVNGRPVRDKLLLGALRAAYADLLPRDRHPVAALFLDCDPEEVDVNVHPAKAEVRFRDPGTVRGLLVGALRQALAAAGHRGSTTTGIGMLGAFRAPPPRPLSPAVERALWAPVAPLPSAPGFAEPPAAGWARAGRGTDRPTSPRGCRSGWRGRSCTAPTSWRRPPTAW